MVFSHDDYSQNVRIKKEKIERIDLSRLLLDEDLKQFDLYDKVVFRDHYYNEWDSADTTLTIERNEDCFLLTYHKRVDYGEEGAEAKNINELHQTTFANDTANLQLFRLLCKETYKVAHYVFEDVTGYAFRCYAKLFEADAEIRTDVISPLMIAIMLRFTDVPDGFIMDAEDNYENLPKQDHPNVIRTVAYDDNLSKETNDNDDLPF